jgi:hypothetical protein
MPQQDRGKIGRNDPCHCGSGRKFKQCHGKSTSSAVKADYFKAVKGIERHRTLMCPPALRSNCGNIIDSHTIQEAILRKIAPLNKLYTLEIRPLEGREIDGIQDTIQPEAGGPWARVVEKGVGEINTFNGFCSKHDNELFLDLEKSPTEFGDRFITLQMYRALCRKLFVKERMNPMVDAHRQMGSQLPKNLQPAWNQAMDYLEEGNNAGESNQRLLKAELEKMILENNYEHLHYYALRIDRVPPIMVSDWDAPKFGFNGEVLQSNLGDNFAQMDYMCTTLMGTTDDKGIFFYAWLGEGAACRGLIESLLYQNDALVPHAITRFLFSYCEEPAISSLWWDKLPKDDQEILLKRAYDQSTRLHTLSALMDDSQRIVDWQVIFHYSK